MDAFPRLIAAGPMFFVSAWLLMIFAGIAGIAGADVGIRPFGYVTSMVVTIGLWLTLAPRSARWAAGRAKPGAGLPAGADRFPNGPCPAAVRPTRAGSKRSAACHPS
jgi:hypothetical protein